MKRLSDSGCIIHMSNMIEGTTSALLTNHFNNIRIVTDDHHEVEVTESFANLNIWVDTMMKPVFPYAQEEQVNWTILFCYVSFVKLEFWLVLNHGRHWSSVRNASEYNHRASGSNHSFQRGFSASPTSNYYHPHMMDRSSRPTSAFIAQLNERVRLQVSRINLILKIVWIT